METDEPIRKSDLILIRPLNQRGGDYKFIRDSWLDGLFYGNHVFAEIPEYIFKSKYKEIIDYVLNKPATSILVACLKDDPSVNLGYCVSHSLADYSLVHWIYVKPAWRNIGIARDLMPPKVQVATHITHVGASLMRKYKIVFDPFLIDL